MERGSTKEQILSAALELFAQKGFEATSISQIADAVGLRKASLYSHFSSKQDILDTLVKDILQQFESHSIFANADWDDPEFTKDKEQLPPETIVKMIAGQMHFITHDPQVSKVRKMLTIEQFQNPELSALYSNQSYEDVLRYNTGLVRFLIRQGILRQDDPEIMAAQLAWPISMWIGVCDREPEREPEMMALLERHVRQFFRIYKVESADE